MKQRALCARLLTAQGLDALTFLVFYIWIGAGIHAERNALLLALMAVGGIWAVAATKFGLSLIVAWKASKPLGASRVGPIRRFHQRHPGVVLFHERVRIVGISVATASGIVGAGFNSAAIIHSTTGFAIRLG